MAFDTSTRNRLNTFVGATRRLITEEFAQKFQSLYGIADTGRLTPLEELGHLDDAGLATAARLRERIDYLVRTHPEDKGGVVGAIDRVAREQAFTVLNRLAAVRMAEKRDLIVESVGRGYQSKGFQVFERVVGAGLGDTYLRYRRYLFCLFDEFAVDLGVLFDRRSPHGILFPREPALLALLELLNAPDLDPLWAEDETIGWIYQYWNDPTERKAMREASSAPRNSRELAVRNQFFTPRYVVEFLTDNSLGRLWYEMTRGQTSLKDQCRYLVRRPNEVFLQEGEAAPEPPKQDNLSQEELLKQTVYIPHRPLKDPREIRLLDPACGSMHFGLYAFDLFEVIYREAWEIAHGTGDAAKSAETFAPFVAFAASFADKAAFLREVPRLIVEHNLHGIDIDPRAAQIAGLSLWLRAQRAWHQAGVKPTERPRITRSNLVCAEPMPGDKDLLREFVTQQFPANERAVFLPLLETIFDRMQLAGEAGSLLKIEEEIRSAIQDAQQKWGKAAEQFPGFEESALPTVYRPPTTDHRSLTSYFWQTAERRLLDALEAYAEQVESADGFQRRLFADDAAQGFAFIDLCRKRYDVVVMNPPFGACTIVSKPVIENDYPFSRSDIYGAFVERGVELLHRGGSLGAITNRTGFFLKAFQQWRKEFLLQKAPPRVFVDLGSGVLDAALVETAAYCLSKSDATALPSTFIRLIGSLDRSGDLLAAVVDYGVKPLTSTFLVRAATFELVPGSPFAYWAPAHLLDSFARFSPFQSGSRFAAAGGNTGDNFRFVRAAWEVPSIRNSWIPYAKGGSYSPYYYDTHLCVNWEQDGAEMKSYLVAYRSGRGWSPNWTAELHGSEHYGRPGLTWPRRTSSRMSVRTLPAGCVFGDKGPGAFVEGGNSLGLFALSTIMNSRVFHSLVDLQLSNADAAARSYEVGIIQRIPVPSFDETTGHSLSAAAETIWRRLWAFDSINETSHAFLRPIALQSGNATIEEAKERWNTRLISEQEANGFVQNRIETSVAELYGLKPGDIHLEQSARDDLERAVADEEESDSDSSTAANNIDVASDLVAYVLGCAYGRWDIRYATGDLPAPELPDPFAPLPVCPPGMLQGDDGLPLSPATGRRLRAEGRYPLDVAWGGILVDDPEHPLDIERRVRDVLTVSWKDRADALEQEACSLLGVPSLREWFRRPSGFFADHLKRYSKSRRQAPIYWPLSTASGSYTLWIYYHRLTDQTLHTAIADFIVPKLKSLDHEISAQRAKPGAGGAKLAELLEFHGELLDLKAELERVIKLPWKPNLNDGVLITASPLWRLFRLGKWQKDLKACWEELESGKYEWAHLAYSIWPKRVEKVCETDRSIAIAHGLEHLCKVEPPKPKKERKAKKATGTDEDELAGLETDESAAPNSRTKGPKAQGTKGPSQAKATASAPRTVSTRRTSGGDEEPARIDIEDTDRNDVMCLIRRTFSQGGARDRETALKQLSEALGYERLGSKVRDILERDLLTAVRRGILTNDDGLLHLTTTSIYEFTRDSLKNDFLTAIGTTWQDREEAIRSFARFLGYARTGLSIEEVARSLINGLLREGRLQSDGPNIRRV